jgi:hypothetical protein
MLLKAR